MGMTVHRAERADLLADGLADLLAVPQPDPFARELVIVPAKGVERWLSQRLSHRLGPSAGHDDGVCAGIDLRSPRSLLAEVLGTVDDDPWAPEQLVWPLLAVIDASLGEPWCRTLAAHLGSGAGHAARPGGDDDLRRGRRYAVARRLARLFEAYAVQRPRLLADWEAGRSTDGTGRPLDDDLGWQPELWRHLVAARGVPSPVQRHASAVAALHDGSAGVALPSRLSLFGHTRIPVSEAELLVALGERHDVHLWLPHPSPALWAALEQQIEESPGALPRSDDTSYERVGHPLLSTLGRDVREVQRTLVSAGAEPPEGPPDVISRPDTLLGWLQTDLARNTLSDVSRVPAAGDDSVQVHACHGPARQVEVLREVLLALLADDPTLEPRDILVACPDIEAYAPLVEAAFGMGGLPGGPLDRRGRWHPGQQLQVRLADRSLTRTNPLLGVVEKLLDLAGGRAGATEVLDLVESAPVRRRFGFGDSDLETITGWVEAAGIRWAYDEEHRAGYGLADFRQNTWRFGLDRVLAGVAMSADAERWVGTTLPLDDVGSTSIDLAGRLAELLERLQGVTDRLGGTQPVDAWLDVLRSGVAQLTAVPPSEEWQLGQVQRELAGLAADAADAAAGPAPLDLRLPDVRALMRERLAGRPTRANFRTGTLTVCTMVPMRSVPHRVVCLLGLDDGVFPRAGVADGDDVLARRPLTGERDARSEDRQLMLDAVLAATDHLVLTYSGANETTGRPRPPAVPLGELLDALDDTAVGGAEHALHHHPLQAFAPDNFSPTAPFSFDAAALAGARAAEGERREVLRVGAEPLPALPASDLDLGELVAFFKAPVRQFLRQRLDVALAQDDDEISDALPVELDALERWQVGDRMLRELLAGRTPEAVLGFEWRRGVLPPGRLGWRLAQEVRDEARPVAELAESLTQGAERRVVDVDVDLGDGRRLRGTVNDIYGDRVVKVGFSRLGPKHWLDAWLPLLALCASGPRPWSAGAVGRGRKGAPPARVAWARVDDAETMLRDLVATYDAGMCAPLPLPVATGHTWVDERHNPSEHWRRKRTRDKWESSFDYRHEDAEPAHVLVWGPSYSFDALLAHPPLPGEEVEGESSRFGALATRLWAPMFDRLARG